VYPNFHQPPLLKSDRAYFLSADFKQTFSWHSSQQELTTNLQAGQSLAEIAQAKGINEDQLISNIKDSMTNKLKQYVEKKDQPEAGDSLRKGWSVPKLDAAVGATANAPTAGAAVNSPEAPATNSSNTASATN
jgi:hypothetical protein